MNYKWLVSKLDQSTQLEYQLMHRLENIIYQKSE